MCGGGSRESGERKKYLGLAIVKEGISAADVQLSIVTQVGGGRFARDILAGTQVLETSVVVELL